MTNEEIRNIPNQKLNEMVSITELRHGDVVEHHGDVVTVSENDFKNNSFFGLTFRGDSYNLGYKKIKRFI